MHKIRTKALDMECARAYESGESISAVADRFGIGFGTVQRALQSEGIAFRPHGTQQRTVQTPDNESIRGYVAGLLDGEGHIARRNQKRGCYRVIIYSTTPELIEWLKDTIGGRTRWDHARTRRRGWKPMGVWSLERSQDVYAFLLWLHPLLIIKKDTATAMIEHIRHNGQFPLALPTANRRSDAKP
jgi:hypothetical protein